MANFSKQQRSSRQRSNKGQNKSLFEPRKLPSPNPNKDIHPTAATTDLLGYRQSQLGETVANIRRSLETQTAQTPAFNQRNNELTAPRQDSSNTVPVIQLKLTIGRPDDKYEREADRVASQVVQQINTPASTQSPQNSVQRSPIIPELQREAVTGGEASTGLTSAINSARGSGQPLDAGLQQSMGQAMGSDFSGVRVHTDARSDSLNRSIQAKAFTTGQNVFFRQGEYQPGSKGGQQLIAHELTHVMQQNRMAEVISSQSQSQFKHPFFNKSLLNSIVDSKLEGKASNMVSTSKIAKEQRFISQVASPSSMIQRNVMSFSASTKLMLPPIGNLTNELVTSKCIVEDKSKIKEAVKKVFKSDRVKSIPVPESVTANLNKAKPEKSTRKSSFTKVIGNIGSEMFFLKTRFLNQAFEGGHIIPHSLWDKDDNEIEEADHYNNLVPMSRTLNISPSGWAGRENWMRQKLKSINEDQVLSLGIDVNWNDPLKLNIGKLANYFKLNMHSWADENATIPVNDWLPSSLKLSYWRLDEDYDEMSFDDFSLDAEELHDTFSEITTVEKLLSELRSSQFNTRISPKLWKELQKLKK